MPRVRYTASKPTTCHADLGRPHLEASPRDLRLNELPAKKIGGMVMYELKKLDKVAYIQLASVYRCLRH